MLAHLMGPEVFFLSRCCAVVCCDFLFISPVAAICGKRRLHEIIDAPKNSPRASPAVVSRSVTDFFTPYENITQQAVGPPIRLSQIFSEVAGRLRRSLPYWHIRPVQGDTMSDIILRLPDVSQSRPIT